MNKINDKGGWKLGKWVVKFPDDKLEKKITTTQQLNLTWPTG